MRSFELAYPFYRSLDFVKKSVKPEMASDDSVCWRGAQKSQQKSGELAEAERLGALLAVLCGFLMHIWKKLKVRF